MLLRSNWKPWQSKRDTERGQSQNRLHSLDELRKSCQRMSRVSLFQKCKSVNFRIETRTNELQNTR